MKLKLKILSVFILLQLIIPGALLALEPAPDITDREVVEKLAKLEAGQQTLRSEMKIGQQALNQRISVLRSEMKSGQEALGKRLDDSHNTMLVLFASLISLIVALFGYIAWDRRTMFKPLLEQVNQLEHDVVADLDLRNVEGSLFARQLKGLKEYARINPEFAEVMRGLALL